MSATDFAWLNQWRWYLDKEGYARRNITVGGGKQRQILMHRLILGLEHGDPRQGEHENRNRLDCRRSNLCIAERAQADNAQNKGLRPDNTSGYRGVSWHKANRKWMAQARLDGKPHYLGLHDTAELADDVVKAFRAVHMPFSEDARAISSSS